VALFCGVDGCKAGWFAATLEQDSRGYRWVRGEVARGFRDVLELSRDCAAIAVDIPIGLSDCEHRICDMLARRRLGARSSSVFPAPVRAVLAARSYEDANQTSRQHSGKGLSKQSWAIVPKIADVDDAMSPAFQRRVIEVHPELCFWALNGSAPLANRKRSPEGASEREELLSACLGGDIVQVALSRAGRGVAADDVLDSLAAAFTAGRSAAGQFERLPPDPPLDARGLRMEMIIPAWTDQCHEAGARQVGMRCHCVPTTKQGRQL
jgi:predicted RNase H-like nuclease